MPVAVYARDPMLLVRKDYGSLAIYLEQALKELAQRGEAEEVQEEEDMPIS